MRHLEMIAEVRRCKRVGGTTRHETAQGASQPHICSSLVLDTLPQVSIFIIVCRGCVDARTSVLGEFRKALSDRSLPP
jgi:hypothetical protein